MQSDRSLLTQSGPHPTPTVPGAGPHDDPGLGASWRRLAALHAACAFAVAQPLFVRLSTQTPFLLDSGTTAGRLILTICGVFFGPPLLLWIVTLAARPLGRRVESVVFALLFSAMLGLFSLQVARRCLNFTWLQYQGLSGWTMVAVALACCVASYRFCRRPWFLRAAVVAALGSFLFPIQFARSGAALTILNPPEPPLIAAVPNPAPVVVVVFDEFCGMSLLNEHRQIDQARYPNFARLADTATWYRNATTVHARTNYAVPAILTGRLPLADRETTLAEAPQNLFTLLQSSGFSIAAFEPVSRLCPEPDGAVRIDVSAATWASTMLRCLSCVYLKALVPKDLDESLPRIPDIWYGIEESSSEIADFPRTGVFRDAMNVSVQFERFLACLPDESQPQLCFLHAMTPHWPWRFLPDGTEYLESFDNFGAPFGGTGPLAEDWVNDDLAVRVAWQQYLLQVGDVDRRLGLLLDRLEEAGVWDDCLLVVAGDHGVSSQAGHSRRVPDGANLSDILSVPLFVKLPGQREGRISDRNVESIDVFPTIAAALGVELPLSVDGDSLLDDSVPARLRKTIAYESGSTAVDAEFEEKYRSLERMLEAFGSGTWNDRLKSSPGPHAGLIGHRIDESERLPRGESRIKLQGRLPRRDSRTARSTACYLQGQLVLDDSDAGPVAVAFVHDGVILGTTRTSTDPIARGDFNCLLLNLQEPLARDELEAYIIHAGSGRPTYEPLAVESW
jgi:hypothetical protein